MTNDQKIDYLNSIVKVKIAPSKVHGVGVIALRDMRAGEKLYADAFFQRYQIPEGSVSKLFPEVKQLLMERNPNVLINKPFIYPDCHIQAFMNHSDDPNYSNITDTLLRDVKEGEEIFEDYRNIPGWEDAFPFIDR